MGCFDFTYADNGHNIRGGRGYFYVTKPVMDVLGLKHPYLQFTYMDEYGNMSMQGTTVDIYALYAAMLSLEEETKHLIHQPAVAMEFLNLLKQKNRNETRMAECMDTIRCDGIDYFFDNMDSERKYAIGLPKMGNQPAKVVATKGVFTGTVPMLVTRKRMPDTFGSDSKEIAANLLTCTDSDPNQGFSPTRNHWLAFKHDEKEGPVCLI